MGGGGFYLLHRARDGKDVFVDAREVAPAAATRDMFLDAAGNPVPGRSTRSALAAAIPGEPAGWAHLVAHYGRLPLAASLEPAVRLARKGHAISAERHAELAAALADEDLAGHADSEFSRIFLIDGEAPPAGKTMRLPDLARSLEALARGGAETFYAGPLARKLVDGVRGLGGLWTLDDLANYRVIEREPIIATYQGLRIVSAPPPSSGGVWLANVLNVLSGCELANLDSATRKHLMLEAMRRGHRDRAQYLGDPAFTEVPVALLTSADYATGLRASIRPDRATPSDLLPGYVGAGGRGVAILGSPGGSFIPSVVLLGILEWQQGADARAIVAAPRLHHQYVPDAVFAEPEALSAEERAGLEARGHSIRPWPDTIGNLQVVIWERASGRVDAASDPRRAGGASVR